jgi:hypothetical protein
MTKSQYDLLAREGFINLLQSQDSTLGKEEDEGLKRLTSGGGGLQ